MGAVSQIDRSRNILSLNGIGKHPHRENGSQEVQYYF